MNAYSFLASLLSTSLTDKQTPQVLQPRTAADELPPYREQPWIIDKSGCRKVDPGMTLVPASRL